MNRFSVTNINLKFLQTFVVVAEYESFREAAEQLHRSQSAISTQIKLLEEQFGVSLFHRTTRNVKLTPEGKELLSSARRALYELDIGLRNIHEAVDVRRGRVMLGCSPTIAATRLPKILSLFEKKYAEVRIEVQELTSTELFDALKAGAIDFAIGPVAQDGNFTFDIVLNESLFALVPRKFISGVATSITLSEMVNMPLMLSVSSTALRTLIESEMIAQNLHLEIKHQCRQAQTLVAMAEAGLGAAILPQSVILSLARSSSTQMLQIVKPLMFRQIAIITMRGQGLSPAAARLTDLITLEFNRNNEQMPTSRKIKRTRPK